MKSNKEIYLVVASLIFSIGLIIAAYLISTAISNAGNNTSSSISALNNYPLEDYELIVDGGWFYLYDTVNGQIWKRLDNDDQEASWVMVPHFSKE